jgi:alkanesulfonate monooxygenase SsuD/methylene tetrahydromethanopterin reductase-like flavin-dependent oxidoreductase (luciferase family)
MDFGVFDHTDRSGLELADFYENRLRLVEAYDRTGFYAYHLAEHHSTPLGMTPSPSVLLSAIAQRTRRLRFGPLVYTLSLYHPLRLVEEICMLDQMSRGRFQLGVGRGISPYELGFYGIDPKEAQARYAEALEVILAGLTHDEIDHRGTFFRFDKVPMLLKPFQSPHPPLWYGILKPESAVWTARNAVNVVSSLAASGMRPVTDRYRAEWHALGRDPAILPKLGISRHVVVAPTEDEAKSIAARAYRCWLDSFLHLWRRYNSDVATTGLSFANDFAALESQGQGIAGTPDQVANVLRAQANEAGANYVVCRFAFGDMRFEESLRSVELFAETAMSHGGSSSPPYP